MGFKELDKVLAAMVSAFGERVELVELPGGEYSSMRYPKFPPIMRFTVKRYAAGGFGNVFSMHTRAMGGMMRLMTLVFTPNLGANVPLLLVDVMAMGKKRAAFVEYYDLTTNGADCPALHDIAAKYKHLPDYPEKPAWYVGERTLYSLIKGGEDDEALVSMLMESVSAYAKACASASRDGANLAGLCAFVERMVREGNPSAATMEKVLGREGAERFFRTATMPVNYTEA